jgi:hypothetical protein
MASAPSEPPPSSQNLAEGSDRRQWFGGFLLIFLHLGVALWLWFRLSIGSSNLDKLLFLVVLACFVALTFNFVSGSMTYQISDGKRKILASGGAAAFIIVISLARFLLTSSETDRPGLTIWLRDSTGAQIPKLKGRVVTAAAGNVLDKGIIDDEGSADLKILTWGDAARRATYEIQAGEWVWHRTRTKTIDTFFKERSLTLALVQNESSCCVLGRLLDAQTAAPIPGAIVWVEENSDTSSGAGIFKIYVSPSKRTRLLALSILKDGYTTYNETITADEEVQSIYLTPKLKK